MLVNQGPKENHKKNFNENLITQTPRGVRYVYYGRSREQLPDIFIVYSSCERDECKDICESSSYSDEYKVNGEIPW